MTSGGGQGNSLRDLIAHFWRHQIYDEVSSCWNWYEEVDLSGVLLLSVEDKNVSSFRRSENYELQPNLFLNPYANFPLEDNIYGVLDEMLMPCSIMRTPEK